MDDEDLFVLYCDLVEDASMKPKCRKKTGGGQLIHDCTCLHVLRDPNLRLPVAKYLANLARKSKEEKDQLIIEW